MRDLMAVSLSRLLPARATDLGLPLLVNPHPVSMIHFSTPLRYQKGHIVLAPIRSVTHRRRAAHSLHNIPFYKPILCSMQNAHVGFADRDAPVLNTFPERLRHGRSLLCANATEISSHESAPLRASLDR